MRRQVGVSIVVAGSLFTAAGPALGQTKPDEATIDLDVVAKRLDVERNSIQPSLGATVYDFGKRVIENVPQGENAPLNQVLLRAPGVVQDSFGQVHVRGDHGNLQYRLDGVQLPEGLTLFNNILATRYANQMSLLTGAMPAQYGLRNAGVVDITLKSGSTDPGVDASVTGGSRNYSQTALSYGGRTGAIDYFAAGQFIHDGLGIENPTASFNPIHDNTDQWYGLAKVTGIVDDNTRLSFIAGGAELAFPDSQRSLPEPRLHGQRHQLLEQLRPRPASVGEDIFRHRFAAEELRGCERPALGFHPLLEPAVQARSVRRSVL